MTPSLPPSFHRLLATALLALAATAAGAETISLGGTGAAMGPMRVLAAEFAKAAPAHSLTVVPGLGTGGSMKALAAGAIDLAVIARPLKPDEAAQGFIALPYAQTALVVATNLKGAGSIASLAEFAQIHAGLRTSWPDGAPIRLVVRPQTDVDTELLDAYSPEMKRAIPIALARPGMVIASTDQEAASYLENTPGAIGITSLALVRTESRQVRLLPLNGVMPSTATLADGSYPYAKPMLLVRRAAATPAVMRFFEFIASPRGRRILAETGHWVPGTAADR